MSKAAPPAPEPSMKSEENVAAESGLPIDTSTAATADPSTVKEKKKTPRPMSDQIRNLIISYMDPCKKILEFNQHKGLRALHQKIPMRIKILILKASTITILPITWDFRTIIWEESGNPLPQWAIDANKDGGLPYDLDRYGKEDGFKGITPGDIEIQKSGAPMEVIRRRHRNQQVFTMKHVVSLYHNDFGLMDAGRYKDRKLRDVMKEQIAMMLGPTVNNRVRRIHEVETLKIECDGGILRLPEFLKIRIRKLMLPINAFQICFVLWKLVDLNCRPLKFMNVRVTGPNDPIFTEKIWFPSAIVVQLCMPEGCEKMKWKNSLLGLRQSKIQLFDFELDWKEYYAIVKSWKENKKSRPIGSLFSMCAKDVPKLMGLARNHLRAKEVEIWDRSLLGLPKAISVPINCEVELNFYVEPNPYYRDERDLVFMIIMEIMPAGTAKPLDVVPDLKKKD